MSDARDAVNRAVEVIMRSPSNFAQGAALTGMIKGVEEFVLSTTAAKELALKVPALERNLAKLKTELNKKEITADEKNKLNLEIQEISVALNNAKTAKAKYDKNRYVLHQLNRDISNLQSALNRALG